MKHKRIGLIAIYPEGVYQHRVMSGVFSQCAKYGYDVVVIASLVQLSNINKEYLHGELNIYELINFDLFDGIIITTIPLSEQIEGPIVINGLLEKLQKECKKPVVSIDLPLGDYHTVYTEEVSPLFHITEHIIREHHCSNIAVLRGPADIPVSDDRIAGVRQAMAKYGLELKESQIYYGDFWYTSGQELARRYISKELELPDAVVCLSDLMAIGLVNTLIEHGIRVPEDVIVTGYEAEDVASVNVPPITSYVSKQDVAGADAVDYIHSLISPSEKKITYISDEKADLCIGATCGCEEDFKYTRKLLEVSQAVANYNFIGLGTWDSVDIGMLRESYMMENLTATTCPEECFEEIYKSCNLIDANNGFYICLNEEWLDTDYNMLDGFSEKMNLALTVKNNCVLEDSCNGVAYNPKKFFDTKDMLPAFLENDSSEPQVYYFNALHFNNISLGYAVLQQSLWKNNLMSNVYRNFLRNINNALEMTRTKSRIVYISEHDAMTKHYNRRGLEHRLSKMIASSKKTDKWLAVVIDMDNLKFRNDTYGHIEGDKGILVVADAVRFITEDNELSVRSGGDEFFVIGIGDYNEDYIQTKINRFNDYIESRNEELEIPVSASIGYTLEDSRFVDSYQQVVDKADEEMYINKRAKKLALQVK